MQSFCLAIFASSHNCGMKTTLGDSRRRFCGTRLTLWRIHPPGVLYILKGAAQASTAETQWAMEIPMAPCTGEILTLASEASVVRLPNPRMSDSHSASFVSDVEMAYEEVRILVFQ